MKPLLLPELRQQQQLLSSFTLHFDTFRWNFIIFTLPLHFFLKSGREMHENSLLAQDFSLIKREGQSHYDDFAAEFRESSCFRPLPLFHR